MKDTEFLSSDIGSNTKRKKENIIQLGIILLLGIPIISFVLSIFFALIKQMAFLRTLNIVILVIGILYLAALAFYYYEFNSNQTIITKTIEKPPLQNCPACQNTLNVQETRITKKLGIPISDIDLECPKCSTRIRSSFPYENWTFEEIDQDSNPEFAWLYSAETLTLEELSLIAENKYTSKAIKKIRARDLARVSNGDFDALLNFQNPDFIFSANSTKTYFFPTMKLSATVFKPMPDEKTFIASEKIEYQTMRTRNNVPYFVNVDIGLFFLTNKRFIFIGTEKIVIKKLSDISEFNHLEHSLIIQLKNRKRPDAYDNLDGALFESVLEGIFQNS